MRLCIVYTATIHSEYSNLDVFRHDTETTIGIRNACDRRHYGLYLDNNTSLVHPAMSIAAMIVISEIVESLSTVLVTFKGR